MKRAKIQTVKTFILNSAVFKTLQQFRSFQHSLVFISSITVYSSGTLDIHFGLSGDVLLNGLNLLQQVGHFSCFLVSPLKQLLDLLLHICRNTLKGY